MLQKFTNELGLIWEQGSSLADKESGIAVNVLDTMTIPALQGAFAVHNSTISVVSAWQIELPDGTHYSAQVGTLSLRAPRGIQQFSSTATGQIVPGFAYAQGEIASNSWGLHYGSASLNQEGSLIVGGYDQSRVLGNVGVFDLGGNGEMVTNLLDIQMGVENGLSPFSEGSYTGLLKLNASFNAVQPAIINPLVPYLYMSPETCAAVAENLLVTLNSQVGLYIWNTTDPQYEQIINSPAYLAFVFQTAGIGNLTIKVFFQLLNLTLEAPIVTTNQQYFPCRPFHASDGSGDYFLGRAFLQAAFIDMNWQEPKFFLAQAPGPGVGASNIRSIGPSDTSIGNDPIENFAGTWARNWTPLSDADNSENTTAHPTSTTNGQKDTSAHPTSTTNEQKGTPAHPTSTTNGQKSPSGTANSIEIPSDAINRQKATLSSGMSSRTKAGIAVGVVVGALAVAGAILLSCLRRRGAAAPPQELDAWSQRQYIWVRKKDRRARLHELGEGLPHEADADHQIHELDVRRET